jgi:hypothetical protein
VKLVAVVMAASNLVMSCPAAADPNWRVDLSARGIGSVELDDRAAHRRGALVPALAVRALRDVGAVQLGASLGAGWPAWYGKADAALAIDHERVLAVPHCELVADEGIGHEACRGARWSIAVGLDAGVGLFYYDAPPETPPSSDALLYWGPLARARLQLHVVDVLQARRAIGLVVACNAAITTARYMSTASGTGVRFEPELEVGLTMRL